VRTHWNAPKPERTLGATPDLTGGAGVFAKAQR